MHKNGTQRTEMNAPDISIVVVSYNTRDLLRECLLATTREAAGLSYEILVVDNASKDGSGDMVASEFPQVQLIRSDINLGFAAANNRAFEVAGGRYIVLLNSDAFLQPEALTRSIHYMEADPKIGIGGARLVGKNGSWQPSARLFPSLINELFVMTGLSARFPKSRLLGRVDRTWADPSQPALVDWVPGTYLMIRKDALETVGKFDERFFLYYEEIDLCRRMKKGGYLICYWPDVSVVHIGGESTKRLCKPMSSSGNQLILWQKRSKFIYYREHHGWLKTWLAREMEKTWYRLHALKNGRSINAGGMPKALESRNVVSAIEQAWAETQGGRVSPPRPWS